jgi:hypothetical protein
MTTAVAFSITPSGAAIIHCPAELEPPLTTKPKFDAEFLERRMRQHRELQDRMARELEQEIIREVRGERTI